MKHIYFDISELFIVGFTGTRMTDELRSHLTARSYGGIILFSRNITAFGQWNRLTTSLQSIRKDTGRSPYFIAIDEEGGTVSRMPDDAATLPGARAIGETGDTQCAYNCAKLTGDVLSLMGCNLNLAPVLDVNVNPANPGIGIRSFGTDAHTVTAMSGAAIRGLKDAGVFCCAKHFPGKGDITRDSHKTLPVCSCTPDQLDEMHLKPFVSAISEQVPCIMTSHAVYPAIDDSPATLSHIFLQKILRDKLGFTGLILSDDLEMGAMRECGSIGETAYRAIMAGCDMVLICHSPAAIDEAYQYLSDKLATDTAFRERCCAAYDRIESHKKRLPWPNLCDTFDLPIHSFSKTIARQALRIARNTLRYIPIPDSLRNSRILLCGSHFRSAVEVEIIGRTPYDISDMHKELRRYLPELDLLAWDLSPDRETVERITNLDLSVYELIIVCSNNAMLFPSQQAVVDHIIQTCADKAILVAVKNPEDLDLWDDAVHAIATFGYNRAAIEALAERLTGQSGQ